MYSFGPTSQKKLETCDERLQALLNEAIKVIDFSVIEGHRTKELQDRYFKAKTSKLRWPNSKHNTYPSLAVDIAPYPIRWEGPKSAARFYYLQGIVMGLAVSMGIKIRFGGDWDGDGDITDQKFDDLPHIELIL